MHPQRSTQHNTVDVDAILTFAGADLNAPEGSQAHALGQVNDAFLDLCTQAASCCGGTGDLKDLRAALARVGHAA
jgi:hypothetical protein